MITPRDEAGRSEGTATQRQASQSVDATPRSRNRFSLRTLEAMSAHSAAHPQNKRALLIRALELMSLDLRGHGRIQL